MVMTRHALLGVWSGSLTGYRQHIIMSAQETGLSPGILPPGETQKG
jgi:hypothetical protein